MSVCLSICLSVCLFVCLFVYTGPVSVLHTKILPQFCGGTASGHVLIYVPSYFDYVRLKPHEDARVICGVLLRVRCLFSYRFACGLLFLCNMFIASVGFLVLCVAGS